MIKKWLLTIWPDVKQYSKVIAVLCLLVSMADCWHHRKYCQRSCKELKTNWPKVKSGEYKFRNGDKKPFWAYCQFEGDHGYMYISKKNPDVRIDFDLIEHSKDKVMVKHWRTSNQQYDTVMENIATTPSYDLSVQWDTFNDYQGSITNGGPMGPQIFLGFLPVSYANAENTQGYKANGQEFRFENCDANPNSYLAFLYNKNKAEHNGYYKECCFWPLMRHWIDVATPSSTCLPCHYFFQFEMHMGGCGGYAVNGFGTLTDIMGAALGLRFDL